MLPVIPVALIASCAPAANAQSGFDGLVNCTKGVEAGGVIDSATIAAVRARCGTQVKAALQDHESELRKNGIELDSRELEDDQDRLIQMALHSAGPNSHVLVSF